MADDLGYTPGTGATVATDDCAGRHVQVVKIAYSADGTATHVTADADGLLVNLGANNDVTGTVTANAGTNLNTSALALEAGGNLAGVRTAVELIDDTVAVLGTATYTEATSKGVVIGAVRCDADTTLASLTNEIAPLQVNAAGQLKVALITALPAGTANIGDVDVLTLPALPAGTNNIGDVDVLTLPALPAGTNNIGDVDVLTLPNVTLAAGTNTNEIVGDVAHDIGVGGNPVLIAGAAQDTDDTAPPNRVSAESDTTRLATDRDGSQFVRPHGPQVWTYHSNGSTALTDATVHAAPGAGLSLYVGTIVFSSGAATAINMFLEEGASTIMGPYYLEATAGRGMSVQFNPPRKITANTALTVTTSAAIAHSVDITGFTAQG